MSSEHILSRLPSRAVGVSLELAATSPSGAATWGLLVYLAVRVRDHVATGK